VHTKTHLFWNKAISKISAGFLFSVQSAAIYVYPAMDCEQNRTNLQEQELQIDKAGHFRQGHMFCATFRK
jgi:hypothetical protein